MLLQVQTFIADVLQNRNGSLLELLTSPRIPLNQRLAQHYGIDRAVGDAFELVDLEPQLYAGLLTHGAVLRRYPSAVQRGAHLVMDRLRCKPVPPPPPSIDFDTLPYMGTTPRERLSSVTDNNAACAGCHSLINPAGFALEAFDEQGRLTGYDTTGALPASGDGSVPVNGPAGLGRAIVSDADTGACVAQRYLESLLDRPSSEVDGPLVRCLANALSGNPDLDLNHLTRLVVLSDALRRTARPAMPVAVASSATAPAAHAIEETEQLLAAFSDPNERSLLQQYIDALAQSLPTAP
jgi:hypothetical protein